MAPTVAGLDGAVVLAGGLALAALAALLALVCAGRALAAAKTARAAAADSARVLDTFAQLTRDADRQVTELRRELLAVREILAAITTAAPRATGGAPVAATQITPPESVSIRAPSENPVPTQGQFQGNGEPPSGEATVMLGRLTTAPKAHDEFHGLAVLRLTKGAAAHVGREFKLPFDRSTIGRAATNRVVLEEDKASRIHAELRYERNRFLLRDHDSTNGTLLNGAPVTEAALKFGDVITIGGTELVFTAEGFDAKDASPARAIAAFERLLERQPDFLPALQTLAFLLERDVARKREAEAVWERLRRLER